MNISEFERTKPVETMKSLNALIKKVDNIMKFDNVPDIYWFVDQMDGVSLALREIREKLKRGE